MAQDVLIVGAPADLHPAVDDNALLRHQLAETGEFARVDVFDGRYGTPELPFLEPFHAVLVYSEDRFSDPVALGDVLAAYVERGHGVVVAVAETVDGDDVAHAIAVGGWQTCAACWATVGSCEDAAARSPSPPTPPGSSTPPARTR